MSISLAFIPDEEPQFPGSNVDIVINFDCLDPEDDCDAQLGIWTPPVAEYCPGDDDYPAWPTSAFTWGGFHPWQCPIVKTWFCTDLGDYYLKFYTSDDQRLDCAVFATVIDRIDPEITTEVLPGSSVPAGTVPGDLITIRGFDPVGTDDPSDFRAFATYDVWLWSEDEPQYGGGIAVGCDGAPGGLRTDTKGSFVPGGGELTQWWNLPMPPGKYVFQVHYGGNHYNKPKDIGCAEPFIVYPVPDAVPTLSTTPSASSVYAGQAFSDVAELVCAGHPTGTLTFELHGPDDEDCEGDPVAVWNVAVEGAGTYRSGDYTTVDDGTYQWVVTYSGDDHTESAETACGDEPVVVLPAPTVGAPVLTTQASPGVQVNEAIFDTATLLGSTPGVSGTITFTLYGPGDTSCASPISTSTVSVSADGTYTSGSYTATAIGVYRWKASYRVGGTVLVETACDDASEMVTVHPAVSRTTPTIFTIAEPFDPAVNLLRDQARLDGLATGAGGWITFTLYPPSAPDCSGDPVLTSRLAVTGNGWYTSGSYEPPVEGPYRWVASYDGDWQNGPVVSACGAERETVTVATVLAQACVWYRSDTLYTCGPGCTLVQQNQQQDIVLDNSTGWLLHNRQAEGATRDVVVCEDGNGNPCSPAGDPYEALVNSPFEATASTYVESKHNGLLSNPGLIPSIHQDRVTGGSQPPLIHAYTDPRSFDGPEGWVIFVVMRLNEAPIGSGAVGSGGIEILFGSVDGQVGLGVSSESGTYFARVKYGAVEQALRIPDMIGRVMILTVAYDPSRQQLSLSEVISGGSRIEAPRVNGIRGLRLMVPATFGGAEGAYAADKDFFECLSFCTAAVEVGRVVDYLQQRYGADDPPFQGITSLAYDLVPGDVTPSRLQIGEGWAQDLVSLSPALTRVRWSVNQPQSDQEVIDSILPALRRYASAPPQGHSLRVFAVLHPAFYFGRPEEWRANLVDFTNDYIT